MSNYFQEHQSAKKGNSLVLTAAVTVLAVVMVVVVAMVVRLTGEVRSLTEEAAPALAGLGYGEERILLSDAALGEIWIPILKGVKASPYNPALFQRDDHGYMQYLDADVPSWRGIDVSFYQGEIDWPAVKAAGIDFAIIRVGYRGYNVGNMMIDECFEQNMEGARDAGLDVGVYFFSQAITAEEAREEAELVLTCIKPYEVRYPVVFDWEVIPPSSNARSNRMAVADLNACALTFCAAIEEAGYTPMLYANKRMALLKYDLQALAAYDFWLAEFSGRPSFYYDYKIWQYSERGQVDGITGNVDLNISFVDYGDR